MTAKTHPKIKINRVKSSNIAGLGYDEHTQTLAVQFSNGGTYHYHDVALTDFHALAGADSIGGHFSKHIRGTFKHTPIPGAGLHRGTVKS
jgi:hypothetical protein